jgi:hypothetical protein
MGAAGLGQTQAFKLKQRTIKKARSTKGCGKFSGGSPSRPSNKNGKRRFGVPLFILRLDL